MSLGRIIFNEHFYLVWLIVTQNLATSTIYLGAFRDPVVSQAQHTFKCIFMDGARQPYIYSRAMCHSELL